jgi:hypothetical protein
VSLTPAEVELSGIEAVTEAEMRSTAGGEVRRRQKRGVREKEDRG